MAAMATKIIMTIASIIFRLRDQRLRGFAPVGFLVADVWRRFTLELWGGVFDESELSSGSSSKASRDSRISSSKSELAATSLVLVDGLRLDMTG